MLKTVLIAYSKRLAEFTSPGRVDQTVPSPTTQERLAESGPFAMLTSRTNPDPQMQEAIPGPA